MVISAGGLSSRRRTWRTIQPTPSPTATPPTTATRRGRGVEGGERAGHNSHDRDAVEDEAVPSLTRLSPSTIVTSLRGTPSRRAIAVAAIGSVGETMAPSTKAVGHVSPSTTSCATTATATVVITTRPTASRPIGLHVVLRSRSDVKNAESREAGAGPRTGRAPARAHLGHARDDAQREPAEDEEDRVGNAEHGRDGEQRGHCRDQPERNEAVLRPDARRHRAAPGQGRVCTAVRSVAEATQRIRSADRHRLTSRCRSSIDTGQCALPTTHAWPWG